MLDLKIFLQYFVWIKEHVRFGDSSMNHFALTDDESLFWIACNYIDSLDQRTLEIKDHASCRNSHPKVFYKKGVLRNLAACNFIKKETLAQMFYCEFCELLRTPFFIEHLWWLLLFMDDKLKKGYVFVNSDFLYIFV